MNKEEFAAMIRREAAILRQEVTIIYIGPERTMIMKSITKEKIPKKPWKIFAWIKNEKIKGNLGNV